MNRNSRHSRRDLIKSGSVAFLGGALVGPGRLMGEEKPLPEGNAPWLRKTLKIGMIGVKGSLVDKFNAAKQAGFEGVELNVPGINVAEAKAAAAASGLIIDGTVGGYHWGIRHSDPDPEIRKQALGKLKADFLQDEQFLGTVFTFVGDFFGSLGDIGFRNRNLVSECLANDG